MNIQQFDNKKAVKSRRKKIDFHPKNNARKKRKRFKILLMAIPG